MKTLLVPAEIKCMCLPVNCQEGVFISSCLETAIELTQKKYFAVTMPVSKHLSILPLTSVKESLFSTYKYALRPYSHVIINFVMSSFNAKSVVSFKIILQYTVYTIGTQ